MASYPFWVGKDSQILMFERFNQESPKNKKYTSNIQPTDSYSVGLSLGRAYYFAF